MPSTSSHLNSDEATPNDKHLEVALTIVYENKPSETIVVNGDNDPQSAELEAFRQAEKMRFLTDAKMLLVRKGTKTRAEFFQQSSAYKHFLANS